jgi:glycerate 2-kinase
MNGRVAAEEIFLAAVRSVLPSRLVRKHLELNEKGIRAGGKFFNHSNLGNIYLVGAGKASAMMAYEAEDILGDKVTGGHVVVKYGFSCALGRIGISEAGHPVPDRNSFFATGKILDIARSAGIDDLVICLISGGGSSLLADLPDGISEKSMMRMHGLLVNSGASIAEINTVRKHLSMVKGGQLARTVYPAHIVSLIISDVPGDRKDVIASGPTVPDPTTFIEAVEVLNKYDLLHLTPPDIKEYLRKGIKGIIPETPKPADKLFNNVMNIIVGNNRKALESASRKASEINIDALIVDDALQGDVSSVAEKIVAVAMAYQSDGGKVKPACLLFGGETTLRITGRGKGGRNQHLALLCSLLLKDKPGITVLAAGTDGNDGPTDAAGAVVDSVTYDMVVSMNLDIMKYKNDFDSWHFFQKAGGHIVTGPTLTNVMDIIIVIIQ